MSETASNVDERPVHVLVCTPAYTNPATAYVGGLLSLQRRCIKERINLTIKIDGGDSLITRARNAMATEFISNPQYTHLMWIDSDIGFEADAVLRLLRSGLPVVGGVYPLKNRFTPPPGVPETDLSVLKYVVGLEQGYETRDPCFMSVREVGTGFMMIKREVFDHLMEMFPSRKYVSDMSGSSGAEHWNFFDTEVYEGRLLSEDYAFCRLWKKAGGQVWADLTSKLDHVGTYAYRGDWMGTNMAMFPPQPPEAAAETDQPAPEPSEETGELVLEPEGAG